MRACVETEGSGGTKVIAILTMPHEWIVKKNVMVRVAYAVNWVSPGGRSELELAVVGAHEHVSIIRASAAVVDAERVVNWDVSAGGSAEACLCRCGDFEKLEDY